MFSKGRLHERFGKELMSSRNSRSGTMAAKAPASSLVLEVVEAASIVLAFPDFSL